MKLCHLLLKNYEKAIGLREVEPLLFLNDMKNKNSPPFGLDLISPLCQYVDLGSNQALPFQSLDHFNTCFNSTGLIMLAQRSMACLDHLYHTRKLTSTQVRQATFYPPPPPESSKRGLFVFFNQKDQKGSI